MSTQLISAPAEVGIDPAEIAARPGSLIELRDDVLRDLMCSPHAVERYTGDKAATGHTSGDAAYKLRRRTCV